MRGWSQGRAAHFGGGRRVAPSDESRLVRLSLLRDGGRALEPEAALEPRGSSNFRASLRPVYETMRTELLVVEMIQTNQGHKIHI